MLIDSKNRPPAWNHQEEGKNMWRRLNGLGMIFAFPPGAGKTRPVCEEIERRHLAGEANLVCVVNTFSGMHVWVENWADWADTPALFVDLRERGSEGIRTAEALAKLGNLVICIVNYASAWRIGYKTVKKQVKVKGQDQAQTVSKLEWADTSLHDVDWDIMVLDEIHKIKSPGSKVSQFFRTKVAPRCKDRVGLTGSLIKKRPGDAWACVKFVSGNRVFPGAYSGVNKNNPEIPSFVARYGVPHPHIQGAIIAWHNLGDFAAKLAQCAYVVAMEDCIDLPPAIHSIKKVKLSPKARKVYDQITQLQYAELERFEYAGRKAYVDLVEWCQTNWPKSLRLTDIAFPDGFIVPGLFEPKHEKLADDVERDALRYAKAWFNDGTLIADRTELLAGMRKHGTEFNVVTVKHVFSVMRKQAQITSGYIIPDTPEDDPDVTMEPVVLDSTKLDELMDKLEANWPQTKADDINPIVVIVSQNYEERIVSDAIKAKFKFSPKVLSGATKGGAKERFDLVASGANDPVFILKAQVGAESIDLRWSRDFIFFSKLADTIQYDQLLARNRRGGQTETCSYTHLIAEGTVDERIHEIVYNDLDLAKRVEKDWRSLIRKDDA